MQESLSVEDNLFNGLEVYSEALFLTDTNNADAFHPQHREIHQRSFDKASRHFSSQGT